MLIRFWGVRGSLPAPLAASQIKSKISAVLERVRPVDLASPEDRERFLANLPEWLFGTVGGNTPCVQVVGDRGEMIVFDAGTGIRELGTSIARAAGGAKVIHLFFSHLHWDHIQGLPFFGPLYNPANTVHFYSPHPDFERVLQAQMQTPTFPVGMDAMGAKKIFHQLDDNSLSIGKLTISWRRMNHPGASYAYLVGEGMKRFIYSTDTELTSDDFLRDDDTARFFGGADCLVLDSQYTLGEAIEKYNWGHSAFSMAVDFASNWGIPQLVLFHHDPTYDDKKLHGILRSARWYIEHMAITGVEVELAREGLELKL